MVDLMDMGSCSEIVDMVQLDQHSSFICALSFVATLLQGCAKDVSRPYINWNYIYLSAWCIVFCVFLLLLWLISKQKFGERLPRVLLVALMWSLTDNRNYSAILATLQITSYALGV